MKKKPYKSPPGRHRHMCYMCGTVWEHNDDCSPDDKLEPGDPGDPHNCPACGTEQKWKYGVQPGEDKSPSAHDHHLPKRHVAAAATKET